MKRLLTLLLAFIIPFTSIGGAIADSLRLPRALKHIEEEAFAFASSLDEVDVPFGAETIGSRAFAGSGLKKIYLPPTVRFIAPDAFDEGDLTIVTPHGSYAKTFADEHGFAWEDGSAHYKLDTIDATEDLWETEIKDSLILEFEEMPRLSTEGITDEAQLAAINEINQGFLEYEELEKQYAANIDALTDAFSSLADEMSKISVTEQENQISINISGARYTLSGDAIRSIGSDYQIVSTERTEDGANVITEVTSGGRTYYMINSASGTIVSSTRNGAISAQSRMVARGGAASGLMKKVQEFTDVFQKLVSAVDVCIDMACSGAEDMVAKASDQLAKITDINDKKAFAAAEKTMGKGLALRKAAESAQLKWASLSIPSNLYSISSDITRYNRLEAISAHGHPIPEIVADDLRMSLIMQMNDDISVAQHMLACDAMLNVIDMVNSVVSILSTMVKFIPALTVQATALQVLFDATLYFAQLISSGRGDQYFNQAVEADNKLHSFVYGYIKDEDTKEPVPNAGVTNGSAAAISKADGSYQLYLFPEEPNSLLFRAKGYEDNGVVVTLNPWDSEQQDIELKPKKQTARVFGVVKDKITGALLEGVQVICADQETTTGADGSYSIDKIESGSCTISFYKTGYARFSDTIVLEEHQQLELNIALDDHTIITTREELEAVANDVTGNYVLGNDISLGDEPWTPLPWFKGTFDGAGHSISGMKINASTDDSAGLFAGLDNARVKNLNMSGVNVDIRSETWRMGIGSICGYLNNGSSLTNCTVSGTIRVTTDSCSVIYAGGLAGYGDWGYITGCSSSVNVTALTSNTVYAGGLAGALCNGEAKNTHANCNVSVKQSVNNSYASLNAFGTLCTWDSSSVLVDHCNSAGIITAQATDGGAYACGARGSNSVNSATVTARTKSGSASAFGCLDGENGKNRAAVLAEATGTGKATAVGLDNVSGGSNSGSVTARTVSGKAFADGCQNAGNNTTNSGSVIAESTSGKAEATGMSGRGKDCKNSGSVSATSVTKGAEATGIYGCDSSDNTGDVTVVSNVYAYGMGIFCCADSTNSGNVNATYGGVGTGDGKAYAVGMRDCDNSTNSGSIKGTAKAGGGYAEARAVGATNSHGSVNKGTVTANSESGYAEACGLVLSNNSKNHGVIYAYSKNNSATAYGIARGENMFNGGQVTAISEDSYATAYGFYCYDGSNGHSSNGKVSATVKNFSSYKDMFGHTWYSSVAYAYNSTSAQATLEGHTISYAGGKGVGLYRVVWACGLHPGRESQYVSYPLDREEDDDDCPCSLVCLAEAGPDED